MMKWFKKLDNPFLLAAEGFIAGALLFWAANPDSLQAQAASPASQSEAPATPASIR